MIPKLSHRYFLLAPRGPSILDHFFFIVVIPEREMDGAMTQPSGFSCVFISRYDLPPQFGPKFLLLAPRDPQVGPYFFLFCYFMPERGMDGWMGPDNAMIPSFSCVFCYDSTHYLPPTLKDPGRNCRPDFFFPFLLVFCFVGYILLSRFSLLL